MYAQDNQTILGKGLDKMNFLLHYKTVKQNIYEVTNVWHWGCYHD